MFGKRKRQVVGCDVGTSAVKLVELKPLKNGEFQLLHAAIAELSPEAIVDGAIGIVLLLQTDRPFRLRAALAFAFGAALLQLVDPQVGPGRQHVLDPPHAQGHATAPGHRGAPAG